MNLLPWLDDLLEIAPLLDRVIKDGVSLTVFVGIAVFLLKRFYKKYRKGNLSQLDRIERKVDLLAERQGIQWDATSLKSYSEVSATKSSSLSILRWVVSTTARTASRFIKFLIGGIPMTDFLSGKKKWLAFIIAVLVNGLNDVLGLGLSHEALEATNYIGGGYIAIEAALDLVRAITNHLKKSSEKVSVQGGQTNAEHYGDSGLAE